MSRLDSQNHLRLIESDVRKQVSDWMQFHGWREFRTGYGEIKDEKGRVVERYGEIGSPDYLYQKYLGGLQTLTVWIETKRAKYVGYKAGELRKDQRHWIALERARGAEVWVVDSLEALKKMYAERIGR